ncbi:MAG: serine acetyltransferase [Eubacteriales bacterium]|nr:serine acetyltransferase [Eubacteriales bacterium]MDD3880732.1 serine acetyltransferase [Eubacteriales bacterium]MDD4511634.1 serine acetyltransferase [Eubacteriales bacterium]
MRTKDELREYLAMDKKALHIPEKRRLPKLFNDEIWKFEIFLRKREYYTDCGGKLRYIPLAYYSWRFYRLAVRLGYSIPIHAFGAGLSIAHRGTIVVNGNARIGKWCRIQECVTIGATNGSDKAPRLGDRVFIGSGARIIGDIDIASGVAIGAGAVVVKSCDEENVTLAGVPAKVVSRNGSRSMIDDGAER